MTDYVILPGTAAKIDVTEITLPDGVTLVERQRMVLADGVELSNLLSVDTLGRLLVVVANQDEILTELRRITFLLEQFTGNSARKIR